MKKLFITTLVLLTGACTPEQPNIHPHANLASNIPALKYIEHGETYNPEAVIPPQCYTKTEGQHNPCYVCHQSYDDKLRPNQMGDGQLQGSYDFSDIGLSNSWGNLFVDRTEQIAQIPDDTITQYINQDNYSPLIEWMKSPAWKGVVPEIKGLQNGASAFDEQGLAKDGSMWVAFNYKPMPSTFWPTNGSTDDVMIRLPKMFYSLNGTVNRNVYYTNLALLEMAITDQPNTTTLSINEIELQKDLNHNGKLEAAITRIEKQTHYVGDANAVEVQHMLYPEGTEFLHTVRYVGLDSRGNTIIPKRMKELRYMKKHTFFATSKLRQAYYGEAKEKHFENLPSVSDFGDRGFDNGFGWLVWGFIENEHGELRKQSKEEQFFCAGCHKTIGTTIDQTFSFPRKVAGASGWGYINLSKINDVANIGEQIGEYATYMKRVGGGDEFRQNDEMIERWFTPQGKLNETKLARLESIYPLITPSKERALKLNKAYYAIVKEQSFLFGRDAVVKPNTNIFKDIDSEVPPLLPQHRHAWDIRLDWNAPVKTAEEYASHP